MAGETILNIVGTMVQDPEMRFTAGGAGVCSFTIASNSRKLNKASGEWEDSDVIFMRCSAWKHLAEHVTDSLMKGDRVLASGRLRQREWEKDGVKRTVLEMEVDEIGPSLKFATVKVNKATREGAGGNGGRATSKAGRGGDDSDQPPF
jgi:single-strand DNA-binding protein